MFWASSQTVSPDFEWGIGRRHQCGVDLVLCEGMRDLVAKIQMELLEICHNLMSSIQDNRFKGHFELGWKPWLAKNGVTMVAECDVLLYANLAKGRRLTQSSCW